MFTKIIRGRAFQMVGGFAQIYTGLGFLGIIGGWSNTGTVMSYILGTSFILAGISFCYAAIAQKNPNE
jgi:hypothetical protein